MTEVQRLAAFCSEGVIKVVAQFQPQTLSVGDMFRVASRRQTFMFRATVASYMSLTNDNFLLKGLEVPFEALSPGAVARPFSRAQLRNVKTIASYPWVKGTIPITVNNLHILYVMRLSPNLEEDHRYDRSCQLRCSLCR